MEYFAALSLSQAEKLKKTKAGSAYLGGGTMLNWRGAPRAKVIVDLKDLGLNKIRVSKGGVAIGATVTIQEIAHSRAVPRYVAGAAAKFTSLNVRNMATIGGGVAGGFFISHLLPVLAAGKASVEYYSAGKKKSAALLAWLKSKKGIVCAVKIKKSPRSVYFAEDKIAASDFPAVMTALGFDLRGGKISDAVVAVSGAGGPLAVSEKAAKYLNGLRPGEADAGKLGEEALKDIRTSPNVKVSARVKRRMIASHLASLLSYCIRRPGGKLL